MSFPSGFSEAIAGIGSGGAITDAQYRLLAGDSSESNPITVTKDDLPHTTWKLNENAESPTEVIYVNSGDTGVGGNSRSARSIFMNQFVRLEFDDVSTLWDNWYSLYGAHIMYVPEVWYMGFGGQDTGYTHRGLTPHQFDSTEWHVGGTVRFMAKDDMTADSRTDLYSYAFYGTNFKEDIVLDFSEINAHVDSYFFMERVIDSSVSTTLVFDSLIFLNSATYCLNGASHAKLVMKDINPPYMYNSNQVLRFTSITVPKGYLEAYQTATNWAQFADIMVEADE